MCLALGALGLGGGAAAGGLGGLGGLLQIGFSVMGQVMQYQGQMAAYNEQVRHRQEQAKQAQETLNQQVAQQQGQYESELNKAQQEKFNVTREAISARSRASASAAESGITGLSVANLMGEIGFEESLFEAETNYNTEVGTKQAVNQLKMARRGAQAKVASIPIPVKPSFGPTLVGIGSSIVGGMSQRRYGLTPGIDNGRRAGSYIS